MNNVLVNIINNISLKQNRHVIKKANNALTSAPNFATTSSKEHLEMELPFLFQEYEKGPRVCEKKD